MFDELSFSNPSIFLRRVVFPVPHAPKIPVTNRGSVPMIADVKTDAYSLNPKITFSSGMSNNNLILFNSFCFSFSSHSQPFEQS